MRRLVVLCVESNGRSKTDYMYINATIKRFYKDDKKIVYRPIFLESKSNYNDRSKVVHSFNDMLDQVNGMDQEHQQQAFLLCLAQMAIKHGWK